MGDVIFDEEHEKGGHFPAWETPEILVNDLRKMFGKESPGHGLVEGKAGYES